MSGKSFSVEVPDDPGQFKKGDSVEHLVALRDRITALEAERDGLRGINNGLLVRVRCDVPSPTTDEFCDRLLGHEGKHASWMCSEWSPRSDDEERRVEELPRCHPAEARLRMVKPVVDAALLVEAYHHAGGNEWWEAQAKLYAALRVLVSEDAE